MTEGFEIDTLEAWNERVCEFRTLFGDRRVMMDADRRAGLKKGFAISYLNLELSTADLGRAAHTFEVAMDEFSKRELMIEADFS